MIKKLDNRNQAEANTIYEIFQNAYKAEAELIQAVNFPPLSRTIECIKVSETAFYCLSVNQSAAAIIEISLHDQLLDINSLTVEPAYFRQGLGNKLLSYILDTLEYDKAVVETAMKNLPAINLYQQNGFVKFKQWTPEHGIEKLAMSRTKHL
jgi:ribosomal protein S18 acetylase RimI-like enzyme